jgi:flagellar FliJ protein
MAFDFRFKVLLRHREYLQKKSQIALAAAQNRYEELRTRKEEIRVHLEQLGQLWEKRQSGGMHVADHLSFRDYLGSLEQQLLALDGELERADQEVEKAKDALIEKEKELKVMESLEEKDRTYYQYEQARKEQRQSDEVAIFKDLHKKSGS